MVDRNDRFFASLPEGKLDSESKALKFPIKIADGRVSCIFQRDCFEPLRQEIERVLSEKHEIDAAPKWSSAIVTGTSGIGKTCFGFYLAYQLVKAGKTVAYNYRNKKRIVLAPSVSELRAKQANEQQAGKKADENAKAAEQGEGDIGQYLLHLLDYYQAGELDPMDDGEEETKDQRNGSHYWGAVDKSSEFWSRLLGNKETWLLVDLHRGDKYEDGRRPCKIVLTSTMRQGDWPDLDSGADTLSKKLYMSPLSLEEATEINSVANLSISNDTIASRFEQFGGSARFLFNDGGDSKVDEAFQAGVLVTLDPNYENTVRASAIVHIIADENFKLVGRKWASQEIGERAVDALIELKHTGEQVWLEATKGKTGKSIMGARGLFAERMWHRAIQGDGEIRLKTLASPLDKSTAVEVKKLVKSFHRTCRFSQADLSDLTSMEVGEYMLPDNDQFPDVDAIAVLNHAPWKSEEAEAHQSDSSACVGIMLQMAIGRGHKRPQGKTLIDIDNKMGTLVKGYTSGVAGSPLYLIYVTESADSWSYHTYTTKTGKSYTIGKMPERLGEIQQFAMSFTKLARS
jgi:hypothetical protein